MLCRTLLNLLEMVTNAAGLGKFALPMMVRQVPLQQHPRLPLLKRVNIPDQMNDMPLQIRHILNEHHLFLQGPETDILLNEITHDIAHDVTQTQEEQD